jgi:hypothetical protein
MKRWSIGTIKYTGCQRQYGRMWRLDPEPGWSEEDASAARTIRLFCAICRRGTIIRPFGGC